MTAKEKAKELFKKYCYAIRTEENHSGYYTNVIYAKDCAIIAVDELLQYSRAHGFIELTKFHEEVKQELEKL